MYKHCCDRCGKEIVACSYSRVSVVPMIECGLTWKQLNGHICEDCLDNFVKWFKPFEKENDD